jgi:NADH-quinone oxidoreductase subunit K
MMTASLNAYVIVSAVLFAIGFFGVLIRRNTLIVFMSLELMLIASTLALVAFSRVNGTMDGNVFVFFILTVAAAGSPSVSPSSSRSSAAATRCRLTSSTP